MNNHNYPGVATRVKAVICDSVLLIILMIVTATLFDRFENVPDFARAIAFVFIFLLMIHFSPAFLAERWDICFWEFA